MVLGAHELAEETVPCLGCQPSHPQLQKSLELGSHTCAEQDECNSSTYHFPN